MLFLSYIQGTNVQEWVSTQIATIETHIRTGGQTTDEFIWDTIMDRFVRAFRDSMSEQRAQNEIDLLRMERGELDQYTAKFENLARLAGYGLNDKLTLNKYIRGLPKGLQGNMIDREDHLNTWVDVTDAAIRQQQKYLKYQTFFQGAPKPGNNQNRTNRPKPTQQQWRQGFAQNPNAMDLTPGRTRARAALTDDERGQLMAAGKCFHCKKQGHMARNCPDKPRQSQARTTTTGDAVTNAGSSASAVISAGNSAQPTKKVNAQELVEMVRGMDDDQKDIVIQEVFMKEDFS